MALKSSIHINIFIITTLNSKCFAPQCADNIFDNVKRIKNETKQINEGCYLNSIFNKDIKDSSKEKKGQL